MKTGNGDITPTYGYHIAQMLSSFYISSVYNYTIINKYIYWVTVNIGQYELVNHN